MNALSQTTDITARPCNRFTWCDGRWHANPQDPEGVDVHASSHYFLHHTVEVAVELDDNEGRPHIWLAFDLRPASGPAPDTFYAAGDARERAAELRRIADAIEVAANDLEALQRSLA